LTEHTVGPAERPIPSLPQLFLGFTRIAAFSFGGVLPWARYVMVERRAWLSPDEFTDTLALCQLLPGPNIVNMSVAIGARFHGPVGSAVSVSGLLVLPFLVVVSLGALYGEFADVPAVGRALAGMAAAAAGLIIAMAVKMALPAIRRRAWSAGPVIALSFGLAGLLRLPLWATILLLAPVAIGLAWRFR
jgi:chromate transporter